MLRGAPPAAGPTGTVGRARATPELHGAVRSGTVGCGPNRDHRPWTGRGGFASTHAAPPAARPFLGSRAAHGPEELLDPERETTRRRMTPRHRRPRDHSWDRGLRADRRSCSTRSGSYASSHARLGTAGRETILGSRAASGPEELRDSERTYASTHAYLGTAGRGTRKGTVGCERAGGAA